MAVNGQWRLHGEFCFLKVLELPNVMLCAVSSVAIEQTIAALERSCWNIAFGDVVLLSDVDPRLTPGSPVRWEKIAPLQSKEAYSHFMIKRLGCHVTLPFVLVVQWDGYVLDHRKWNPAFLEYDYIGATWPQFDDAFSVGNGGFSLRSRRLLEHLSDDIFQAQHPEDVAICRTWRRKLEDKYSIRFADDRLASTFSAERSSNLHETFGFHGFFNLPDILPLKEIRHVVSRLPDSALLGMDGADFILRLGARGHHCFAWQLLARRLRKSGLGWRQGRLIHALARCSMRSAAGSA